MFNIFKIIRRLFVALACLFTSTAVAQDIDSTLIYDSRKRMLNYTIPISYATGSALLYKAWYEDYPTESFHFFNDSKEWEGVDKAGHIYSGYIQTQILSDIFLWAGYPDDNALWKAALLSVAYQSSIEIMDGFSSGWGFSIADMASNIVGNSLYIVQEKIWGRQKVKLKMSSFPVSYPDDLIYSETGLFQSSLNERATNLYGGSWLISFLKDYNGQTYWFSSNPWDWGSCDFWPSFLSFSFGYGAHNMYGGFENRWEINDENFIIDPVAFPRYRQYILSLDYDLSKIKAKKPWLRTVLNSLNILKWPSPALEYRSNGKWVFHLMFLN